MNALYELPCGNVLVVRAANGVARMAAILCVVLAGLVLFSTAGCETSSHKSVRMYEYDDGRRPAERTSDPAVSEESGEWEMVSPGEMVPPGETVVEP